MVVVISQCEKTTRDVLKVAANIIIKLAVLFNILIIFIYSPKELLLGTTNNLVLSGRLPYINKGTSKTLFFFQAVL